MPGNPDAEVPPPPARDAPVGGRSVPSKAPQASEPVPDVADEARAGHAGGRADDALTRPLDPDAERVPTDHWTRVVNYYITNEQQYGGVRAGASVSAGGSVAGADVHGESGRRAVVVGVTTVAVERLEKLRRVTVPTPAVGHAADLLQRKRLVVLQGPAGVGKATAALALLGHEASVIEIDPAVTVEQLVDFGAHFHHGPSRRYLVESLSTSTARALNGFALHALTRELADQDAQLVMTVDRTVLLDPEVQQHTVPCPSPPDVRRLVETHVAYHSDGPEECSLVLERYPPAHVAVQLEGRGAHVVDRVALALVHGHRRSDALDEVLAQLGLTAHKRVREWLAHERSAADLGFFLSAALLSGCTYATISAHGCRLEELLATAGRIDLGAQPLDLTRTRTERLERVMAVVDTATRSSVQGSGPTQIVRMCDPWLPPALLDVIWQEYDLVAEALLTWLEESGSDPDLEVRLLVAAAAGRLAQLDFATVHERLLVPWALTDDRRTVLTAAAAFAVPVCDDGSAAVALGVLRHWQSSRRPEELRVAAALALGGGVGLRFPGVGMAGLRVLAQDGSARLLDAVDDSVRRLVLDYVDQREHLPAYVLAELVTWLDDTDASSAATAKLATVRLLRSAADPASRDGGVVRSLLDDDAPRTELALLLNACLSDPWARSAALKVLHDLLVLADDDERLCTGLGSLLITASAQSQPNSHDNKRLNHYLARWSQGSRACASSARIGRRLAEERS